MTLEVAGNRPKSRADYFMAQTISCYRFKDERCFRWSSFGLAKGLTARLLDPYSGPPALKSCQQVLQIFDHAKNTSTLKSNTPKLPHSNSKHPSPKQKSLAATDHSTPKCRHPCCSVARGQALAPCSAARWAKMMLSPSFGFKGSFPA